MAKRIKRAVKEINRRQNGQVLVIMLIVLALGGIVLAPTLNHAATSIKHQQLIETDALELYAADSGIDYALFKLSNGETDIDNYPLDGKTVSVNITGPDGEGNYLITSTATSAGGSDTTIRTGVSSSGGFAYLLDNAITSNGDVILQPGSSVVGNVTASGTVDGEENVTGNVTDNVPIDNWPSAEQFISYYEAYVDTGTPFTEDNIDVANDLDNPPYIESLYRDGPLDITNTDINIGYNVTLNGTVYVTDFQEIQYNLKIGKTKQFTLDLNGQTIFCEGAIEVSKCTIIGSGCIIAVGDVYFAPKGDVGSENDFVFIMSIDGTTELNPSGSFYGSIAGDAHVTLQPGCTLEWNSIGGEGDLNFPSEIGVVGGSTEDMVLGGWDIS